MKRERNRSGNATMLVREFVKRGNGLWIAKYDRYLSSRGRVGGLALRAGLGFVHLGGQQFAEFRRNRDGSGIQISRDLKSARFGEALVLSGVGRSRLASNLAPFACTTPKAVSNDFRIGFPLSDTEGKGGRSGWGQCLNVHRWLHWLTTGPYSHVTSDVSTTVRRN